MLERERERVTERARQHALWTELGQEDSRGWETEA